MKKFMKKTLSMVLALSMVMVLSTGTVLAKSDNKGHQKFKDTNQHWANQAINEMAAEGLLKGYPDGTFKPEQQLTQGEAITLIMRISKEDSTDTSTIDEEDAQLDNVPGWVRKDADKASKKGIINLNRFHSAMQVSRAQTAVMIAKALELEPVDVDNIPFKDGILISEEDVGYILALYQKGIMIGTDGKFNPNSALTRAEMASILQRILNNSETEAIVTPAKATVVQGGTQQLTAAAAITGGTAQSVNWTSSDTTNKVTVNENGLVTVAADAAVGDYVITATSKADSSKTGTSTITVAAATAVTGIGAITGTAQVGQTLTAGALMPTGTTATYQWLKCATPNGTYTAISGATSNTYTLQAADVNYYIEVVATGSYSGTVTSICTGPVAAATAVTGIGAITGTAQVGQTLTAGVLTPAGATATYQWLKCATPNGTYTAISGAISNTYTLQAADVNYYIEVVATGNGSYSGTATSICTGPVVAAPIDISAIAGVTAPAAGETPVSTITATSEYTGTVTWTPALIDGKFVQNTAYTATITITPATGYTLAGVTADFFKVAGATTVTYTAGSSDVLAVFPTI